MALVAVHNKKPISAFRTVLCIAFKVLQLFESKLIYSLSVFANTKTLIAWNLVTILRLKVVLSAEDHERQDHPALRVNSLDYRNPLTIA
jgi:hypothetical protein